jgi:YD repeat-containing protein
VDDASGQEHTSFDSRGRIQWTVKRVPDPQLSSLSSTGPGEGLLVSYKTEFRYDAMDRVTRLIYPDNDEVGYEYNERGLMQRIVGGPNGTILSRFVYTPSAQQQQLDYGNGVRTTHDYDNRQRLKSLVTRHSSLGTELVDFGYAFDNVSNIQAIYDRRTPAALPADDKRRNTQRSLTTTSIALHASSTIRRTLQPATAAKSITATTALATCSLKRATSHTSRGVAPSPTSARCSMAGPLVLPIALAARRMIRPARMR